MTDHSRDPSGGAPRRRPWRWIALFLLLLLMGLIAYKAVPLYRPVTSLVHRATALRALARQGPAALAHPQARRELRDEMWHIHEELRLLRDELRPLLGLAGHLGGVPRIGGELAAAPALLDAAIHLTAAAHGSLGALEPALQRMGSADPSAGDDLGPALEELRHQRPALIDAADSLRQTRQTLDQVDATTLSPRVAPLVVQLKDALPALEAGLGLLTQAPLLLGHDQPATYLILAQNNHELRPTGGFISGAGLIEISAGAITAVDFMDSYQVDARCGIRSLPPAPEPLRRYLWASALVFRDANWSPDFPVSAQVAASIFKRCQGVDVDGVIALDMDAVAFLLEALGPLHPDGYAIPVDRSNLMDFVAEYWANPLSSVSLTEDIPGWWSYRKDFMADLLGAAVERIREPDQPLDPVALIPSLRGALEGKHLLVFLRDPEAAAALALAGWDGAIAAVPHDYLLLVDANLGFRKVNPHIHQRIHYTVDLHEHNAPRAQLTLHYENRSHSSDLCLAGSRYDDSYDEMMQGCYWNYLRVYVPPGSQLLDVRGADSEPDVSTESGKTVYAVMLLVAPGESRQVIFRYALPPEIWPGPSAAAYRLHIGKQPGSPSIPLTLALTGGPWRPDSAIDDAASSAVHLELTRDRQVRWVQPPPPSPLIPALTAGLGALAGLSFVGVGLLCLRPRRRSGPADDA